MGNIYAYNNLGKIYENRGEYDKAYKCYLNSANLGESWAANKIGEYQLMQGENPGYIASFDFKE